ncbi:MAG: Leucine-rich repeat (LRR) protein [Crocinitomix sp.]
MFGFSQTNHLFKSLEEALQVHPDSVYRLDLSRASLKVVPSEIFNFKNLRELDLSKNKLTELPNNFVFQGLEVLNLTKNKFEIFPTVICKISHLKQLFLGKNHLSEIPECIGTLSELVIFDIWFNTISVIPESITQLKKLKSFDLRGMNYSDEFQKEWRDKLPWVTIQFDVGCDCGL